MEQDEKIIMFQNRLSKVFRHLRKQAQRQGISCYRIYDHDLPEFPFCIEFYGEKLYVAEYKRRHGMTGDDHDVWMEKSLNTIQSVIPVELSNIFLRLRQRKPGRFGQYQKLEELGHEFVVEENGLKFIINLTDYLDTGLFLDHRSTRHLVREQSAGKKVLNLFSYTGSFSVYAASGLAAEIISVDLSNTYLSWSKKNFMLNNFQDPDKYKFFQADVVQYLKTLPPNYFDMVILDPPTFSNSKRMSGFLDVQRDHPELINQCLVGMKPGGNLYFSTNFTRFQMEKEKIASASIKDITKATTPFDFVGRPSRWCFLINK